MSLRKKIGKLDVRVPIIKVTDSEIKLFGLFKIKRKKKRKRFDKLVGICYIIYCYVIGVSSLDELFTSPFKLFKKDLTICKKYGIFNINNSEG